MHDDHIHQPALTIAGTVIAAVAAIAVLGAFGLPIAGLVLVGGALAQPNGSAARFALIVPGVVLVVLSIVVFLFLAPFGGLESGAEPVQRTGG
jgi:hypothetical protein